MTAREREDIKLLNKSRVRRVSRGSGTAPADVNRLTKQFDLIQKMTKQMSGMGPGGNLRAMRELSRANPGMVPGVQNMPSLGGRGSTKTESHRSRFKQKKRKR